MCPPTDAPASTPPALDGLPVEFTVSGANSDESWYCWAYFRPTATLTTGRAGQTVIADRHYVQPVMPPHREG